MTYHSRPTIKLSRNFDTLVEKEMKLVSEAINSNKSLQDLANQIKSNQGNFQLLSESWGLLQSKIRHPNLNTAPFESMVKTLDSVKSATEMKAFSIELEKNFKVLKLITASLAMEKLVLASAYSSSAFAKSVADILNNSRPASWKDTEMSLTKAVNWGLNESIASVHVLNSQILNDLVRSKSRPTRRKVLEENRTVILKTCLKIAEGSKDELVDFFQDAISSFEKRNYPSAQSLSANIIETLVQRFSYSEGINKNDSKSKIFLQESETRTSLSVENFVILHVLAGSYSFWKPNQGTPVPQRFNRNVTAHYVHKSQYNLVNALESIMLCGALFATKNANPLQD